MPNILNSLFKRFMGSSGKEPSSAHGDDAHFASSFASSSPGLSGVKCYGPGGIVFIAGTTATLRAVSGDVAYRAVTEPTVPSDPASGVRVHVTASDGAVLMSEAFKTMTEAQPVFDAWMRVFCKLVGCGVNAPSRRGYMIGLKRAAIVGVSAFLALYVMGVALNLSRHGSATQVADATSTAAAPGPAPATAADPSAPLLAPVWTAPTAAASGAQQAAQAQTREALSAADVRSVKAANSILANGKPSDPAYWVFAAATCPSCQAADAQASLVKGWAEHVIPVGFTQQDKTEAAAALCSPDPAHAWHLAMIGAGAGLTKTCPAGLAAVEKNDQLFLKLGFTATPTLMTSTGHLGVGSADASVLRQWLTEYSKSN